METIGEKIRRIRKSKGISQMTVADTCNIKQSSYANIESGKTQNITIEIGKGIAKALDVSFNELFEIEVQGVSGSDVESLLNEKKAKIEDLQKQIEKTDKLNDFLQEENKWLKHENALYRIFRDFFETIQDELFILGVKQPERTPIPDMRIEHLKEIIAPYLKTGYPDKKSILSILFNNIDFIEFIELKTSGKEDFIKESTTYINKFFPVSENEVEKFVKYNVTTKWDTRPDKITNQMKQDFFQYWKDSE
jgi:transcriptional regulator with XRE-family HTH domain